MNRLSKFLSRIALAIIAAAPLAACTMIQDSVEDCPTGLYVRFVYDYNTQRADMFKDHVGHVALFIYDSDGKLAAERIVSNSETSSPLSQYGYAVHLDPSELRPGKYRLQAVAMQKDWEDALATPGAKYRRNSPSLHDELTVVLDRGENRCPGSQHFDVSDTAPLDTLWHTLKVTSTLPMDGNSTPEIPATKKPYSIYPIGEQMVEVADNRATYATVSLIRDTKHLNITLRQLDEPTQLFGDMYDVRILDNNSTVSHDNSVVTTDSLHYSPYASWTSRFLSDGTMEIETVHKGPGIDYTKGLITRAEDDAEVVQRTAHYNLMFNRLMYNADDNADNARLMISNKETGAVVADINLPSMLSQGRMAYEIYNYGHQEYLDREYDYHLDFFLKGDKWLYCDIVINVLSWAKRTQNVEL
ncbi:hypothetical protein EEL33_14615 [Muribaculaceae bacterium Isolate-037 (Harlan)]|nr:hypothetical protein EEL33_14615 [Muribaculaceae bacterium Isolate-037 (Harlan)]